MKQGEEEENILVKHWQNRFDNREKQWEEERDLSEHLFMALERYPIHRHSNTEEELACSVCGAREHYRDMRKK